VFPSFDASILILIAKLNKKNENRRKIIEKQKKFVSLQSNSKKIWIYQ